MKHLILPVLFAVALACPAFAQPTGLPVDSLKVGDTAPTFVMKKLGTTDYVFLRDYVGTLRETAVRDGKTPQVVVLSFFATWCKPCALEMPELAAVASEFSGRGVVYFFVNVSEQDPPVAAWRAAHPEVAGTILMDPFAANAIKFGVDSLPRTVVIGRDGIVHYIERGFQTEGYRERIRAALETVVGG
jgi:thiol-disulfide isomerase/thioredoxin